MGLLPLARTLVVPLARAVRRPDRESIFAIAVSPTLYCHDIGTTRVPHVVACARMVVVSPARSVVRADGKLTRSSVVQTVTSLSLHALDAIVPIANSSPSTFVAYPSDASCSSADVSSRWSDNQIGRLRHQGYRV